VKIRKAVCEKSREIMIDYENDTFSLIFIIGPFFGDNFSKRHIAMFRIKFRIFAKKERFISALFLYTMPLRFYGSVESTQIANNLATSF
jgi:hypothetical protein